MAISAAQVKSLRDKTGVSMMECKKALEESEGNEDAALKVLRERGIAKAAKRGDRVAAEGLVSVNIAAGSRSGVAVLVTSETDFVSRNEEFITLVESVASVAGAAGAGTVDTIHPLTMADGRTVQGALEEIRGRIGEKIELGAAAAVSGDVVAGYVHPPGKIGVLVAASAPGIDSGKLAEVTEGLRSIAMHIAAFNPRYLDASQVDEATLAAERDIYANKARNEGKPENIIPRVVEGGVKAFFKENCLVEQAYAVDPKKNVGQVVTELAKSTGIADLKITKFARVAVGGGTSEG